MPFSDEQVVKLIETSVATATKVDTLTERLFGDNSDGAGALAKLYTIAETHNTNAIAALNAHAIVDKEDFKEVNNAVAAVDKKVTWYSGAIAALGAVGTVILGLMTWHAASVAARAAEVANQLATHSH